MAFRQLLGLQKTVTTPKDGFPSFEHSSSELALGARSVYKASFEVLITLNFGFQNPCISLLWTMWPAAYQKRFIVNLPCKRGTSRHGGEECFHTNRNLKVRITDCAQLSLSPLYKL